MRGGGICHCFAEIVRYEKDLLVGPGCPDCLDRACADGGGSSTLWTDRTGVLNHPFDNKVFDHEGTRVVPNALIVR